MKIVNGDVLMSQALSKLNINLVDLIAEVAVWCSPEYVKKQPGAVYPNKKRGKKTDRGKLIDGIYIDDNTYANVAIKRAIGKDISFENFFACHIWPETAYDERYYSYLPNLVLIPKVVAGLSDHFKDVIDVLKYRSFEQYGWYPEEEEQPQKPACYPKNWNTTNCSDQIPSPADKYDEEEAIEEEVYAEDKEAIEVDKVKRRIPGWLSENKDGQLNSQILIAFMRLSRNGSRVLKDDLRKACADMNTFESNFSQMRNFSRNNHAKVFEEIDGGYIVLWPSVSNFVREEYKKYVERGVR